MGIPEDNLNLDSPVSACQKTELFSLFYAVHCDSVNQNLIKNIIHQVTLTETGNTVLLGDTSRNSDAVSVVEYCTKLYRQFALHGNEREMILSHEDQMVTLQLCLAERNKERTGDFDVEVSRVLDAYKSTVEKKLHPNKDLDMVFEDQEFQEIQQLYKEFCKDSNVVDQIDVLRKLQEEMAGNLELSNTVRNSNFVFITSSVTAIEKAMLKFLTKDKQLKLARAELPLDVDEDQDLEKSFCDVDVTIEDSSMQKLLELCQVGRCSRQASVTERYIEKVILGYLHLLVNSRSELALAQVINVPERGLDHKAFTDLKRAAKHKKMPMYQTAVSFVMRKRLGGKSYAPDPNVPLGQHVKGLAEFVDLINKLQTIIEEDNNSSSSIRRVLNAIKNSIVRCKDNTIRCQSVDAVNNQLQNTVATIIEKMNQQTDDSPKRKANAGGSMLGRKTLKIIRHILDSKSGQPLTGKCVDVLTDGISSQKTPIRFPCLMSQFRSPLEASPDGKADRTLAERMKEKLKKKEKKVVVQRYQAHMDWAQPLHHVGFNTEPITIADFVPSKTIVHASSKDPKASGARKILESMHDQENITITSVQNKTNTSKSVCPEKLNNKTVTLPTESKKRTFGQTCFEQPASKKPKKTQSSSQRKPSKKTTALQKGQKQLTTFFRL